MFAPNAALAGGIHHTMTDPRAHLLARLEATLMEVEHGLRFRNHEAARQFRAFLLKAIAELEGRGMDAAA